MNNIQKLLAIDLLVNSLITKQQWTPLIVDNINDIILEPFMQIAEEKIKQEYQELRIESQTKIISLTKDYFDAAVNNIKTIFSNFIFGYITEINYYSNVASVMWNQKLSTIEKTILFTKIKDDMEETITFFKKIKIINQEEEVLPFEEVIHKIENKIIVPDERIKIVIENQVKFEPLSNNLSNDKLAEKWLKEKSASDNFYINNAIEKFWIFNRLNKYFLKHLTFDNLIKKLLPTYQQYLTIITNFLNPITTIEQKVWLPALILENALETALKNNPLLDARFNFSYLGLANDLAKYEDRYYQKRIKHNLNHWYHQKNEKSNDLISKNLNNWKLFLEKNKVKENKELLENISKAQTIIDELYKVNKENQTTTDNEFYKKYQQLTVLVNLITTRIEQKHQKKSIVIENAITQLDNQIFGLETAKNALWGNYIINQQVNKANQNYVCLVGKPGVGKTALATSFAKTINKIPIIISPSTLKLSDLIGHGFSYQHSKTGRLTEEIIKTKDSGQEIVLIFDEIDKIDKHAEGIEGMLLQIFDVNQNNYYDPYLETNVSLKDIAIICTANDIQKISKPLLSRLQEIKIKPYTALERKVILKENIIPKILKETNHSQQLIFDDSAIEVINGMWDSKQGIRLYEQIIRTIIGQYHLKNEIVTKVPFTISANNLSKYLLVTNNSLVITNKVNPWNLQVLPPDNITKEISCSLASNCNIKDLQFQELRKIKKLTVENFVNYEKTLQQNYEKEIINSKEEVAKLLTYLNSNDEEKVLNFNFMAGLKNISINIYNDIIITADLIFTMIKENSSLQATLNHIEHQELNVASTKRNSLIDIANKVINDFALKEQHNTIYTNTVSVTVTENKQRITTISKTDMAPSFSSTKTENLGSGENNSVSKTTGKNSFQIPLTKKYVIKCIIKTLNHLKAQSEFNPQLWNIFIGEDDFIGYHFFPTELQLNDEILFNIQYYNFQVINKLINNFHYPWILILEQIKNKLVTTIELYKNVTNLNLKNRIIILVTEFQKNINIVQTKALTTNFLNKWFKNKKLKENKYLKTLEEIETHFKAIAVSLQQSNIIEIDAKNLLFTDFVNQSVPFVTKNEKALMSSSPVLANDNYLDFPTISKNVNSSSDSYLHDDSINNAVYETDWKDIISLQDQKLKAPVALEFTKKSLSLCQ